MSTPPSTPKKRGDRRPTLTLKGDEFGPEFRSLLNKAAKKAGKTQAAFVAETLDREARRILSGTPPDNPDGTPQESAPLPAIVARMEESEKRSLERADKTDERVAELAEQMRRMEERHQRDRNSTLWRRFRGQFR